MNRRAFITSTTAAAIGLGSSAVLPKVTRAQRRESVKTPAQPFWPDKARLVISVSMQRRMMSISMHDRISGIPGRVKLVEEFIRYAQKQKGVVFMRKDEIAKWALSAPNVPHEA